mgnify:CR=1 FL=1
MSNWGSEKMYFLEKVMIKVPVRPDELRPSEDMDTVILKILRSELEGSVWENIGLVLAVIDAKSSDIGSILYGSPNVFFDVEATLLVYKPLSGEIIEGEVVDVAQQAVYVNLGCIDAFLPTPNLFAERCRFDAKERILRGVKSKIVIQRGDLIRARIIKREYRIPELLPPLARGPIVKPAVEHRPKSEIRVILRARDTGLGPLKVLEQARKEVIEK